MEMIAVGLLAAGVAVCIGLQLWNMRKPKTKSRYLYFRFKDNLDHNYKQRVISEMSKWVTDPDKDQNIMILPEGLEFIPTDPSDCLCRSLDFYPPCCPDLCYEQTLRIEVAAGKTTLNEARSKSGLDQIPAGGNK